MFRNWILQNFPYIEDDFDALTDYQLFCKICGYVLAYSKDNKEMKEKILEFENYFKNLDVQEEINNKLDEMASDGTLDDIINQNIFEDLNNEIKNNYVNSLSDSVQTNSYANLDNLFNYEDFSVSGIYIIGNKGIAVANDWSQGGSGGTKFNIVSFTYLNKVANNVILQHELLNGHANSICKLSDNKLLIAGNSHSYIYDIDTNSCNELVNFPSITACSEYKDYIYMATPSLNRLYKASFNSETNNITIIETYTIDNLYENLNTSQGMVIYDDKIIFPTASPNALVIYDLETRQLIKSQLITAPYLSELEDGFILDNEMILVGSYGEMFTADIYSKHTIGGYSDYNISKSLTNVMLYNDPIRLNFGKPNTINFKKNMFFSNLNSNSDIGTVGSQFESLTMYLGFGSVGSTTFNLLTPVEIPCFKNVQNANLHNNYGDLVDKTSLKFCTFFQNVYNDNLERYTVSGTCNFAGGDSIPTLNIVLHDYVLEQNFSTETNRVLNAVTTSPLNVYLIKIIGHRKVGKGY